MGVSDIPERWLVVLLFAALATLVVLLVQVVRGKTALKTKFFDITPVVSDGGKRIDLQKRLDVMHKAMWLFYGAIREEHPSYRELRLMEFMLDCERYFTLRILLNHITVDEEYVNEVFNDVKSIYIRTFRDEGEPSLDEKTLKGAVRSILYRVRSGGGKK